MVLFQEMRARARYVIGPVLGVCAVGYFAFHVVHGDRGLIAWWDIRVRLMNPGSLDADMLEEQARLTLNYGHADDIIILDPKRRK